MFSLPAEDLRNPRGGDPELAGCLREGEPELGHEPHRDLSPDGRDRLTPAPATHLLGGNACTAAVADDPFLGVLPPPVPPPLGPQPGIPRLKHLLHEGPGPEDPGIRQDRRPALAGGPNLRP